jgi:hypothetical protein
MWISFADTAPQNLKRIEKILTPFGLRIQASGVRWAPLVAAPPGRRSPAIAETFPYPEVPPSSPSEVVRLVHDVKIIAEALGTIGLGVVSSFLYDALKSWLNPNNGKRIRAKLGDLELETNEISVEDFRKILNDLRDTKAEAEARSIVEKWISKNR